MGAQAGVLDVTEHAHLCGCPQPSMHQAWREFLPCSSLSPWALVGEASRSHCGLEAPGLSPESELLPSPQTEQRRGCCGKRYCIAGSVPSASRSPDSGLPPSIPRPRGKNFSWAGPQMRVQQLPPPPS